MTNQVAAVMSQIKLMSIEDQRALNGLICANLRHASKIRDITEASKFSELEVVEFDAGRKGIIKIQITGFSRDYSKVKGVQLNSTRGTMKGMSWTASAALCFKVPKAEAEKLLAPAQPVVITRIA